MSHAPWTEQEDDAFAELWEAGLSCNEIALHFGKSKNAVAGRRNRLNLPMRKNPATTTRGSASIDQVAEMLSNGIEVPDIARRLMITRDTARGMLQRIRRELGPQAV